MASNLSYTILPSASRTAAPAASADVKNHQSPTRGLLLFVNATVPGAAPSITVFIEGKDEVSGQYYTILQSAAITTTSFVVLKVFPGATPSNNVVANDVLPSTWRIRVTHANTDPITYSVGADLLAF
jgi:hypothetical protein